MRARSVVLTFFHDQQEVHLGTHPASCELGANARDDCYNLALQIVQELLQLTLVFCHISVESMNTAPRLHASNTSCTTAQATHKRGAETNVDRMRGGIQPIFFDFQARMSSFVSYSCLPTGVPPNSFK
jgi:hypothetical protein